MLVSRRIAKLVLADLRRCFAGDGRFVVACCCIVVAVVGRRSCLLGRVCWMMGRPVLVGRRCLMSVVGFGRLRRKALDRYGVVRRRLGSWIGIVVLLKLACAIS